MPKRSQGLGGMLSGLLGGAGHRSSILRYGITGAAVFAVDFMVWITCVTVLGWDVKSSQVLSRSVGALAGFFGHRHFTFAATGPAGAGRTTVQGGSYLAVTLLNIAISPFLVAGCIAAFSGFPASLVLGKLAAEAILVVVTYVLLRLVFVGGRTR